MKLRIIEIKQVSEYIGDEKDPDYRKYREVPNMRDVKGVVVSGPRSEQQFRLPAEEVDGLINVGSVYELMFARRAE